MDPSSKPIGNISFVLTEACETPAGLADHWKLTQSWEDFTAVWAWVKSRSPR